MNDKKQIEEKAIEEMSRVITCVDIETEPVGKLFSISEERLAELKKEIHGGKRRMTSKELLEDLLIEFDELDMQPMLLVPNPLERAKSWKRELEYSIKHLEAEIALSVIENLETEGLLNMTPQGIENLKKKYTEGEG